MVRRNPAFRIAIGGLTIAVMLCLVAAISLMGVPSSGISTVAISPPDSPPSAEDAGAVPTSSFRDPIEVAMEGEVQGLLNENSQKLVPEPLEYAAIDPLEPGQVVNDAHEKHPFAPQSTSTGDNQTLATEKPLATAPPSVSLTSSAVTAPKVPHQNSETATRIETEIVQLKGQVSELVRTQLEGQLAEIRHAEQLLTTHQSTRMVEELQREVDQLKRERLQVSQFPLSRSRSDEQTQTAPTAANLTESPNSPQRQEALAASESVALISPTDVGSSTRTGIQPVSCLTRVRIVETTGVPGRFDVDADEATLQEFLAKLGPAAGWNLISAPGLQGTVTYRWSGVDLRQALTQVLKVHGWQIRQAGELAIIETLSTSATTDDFGDPNAELEARQKLSSPITLDLATETYAGSTFDQATGILIQPGLPSRGTQSNRTRIVNSFVPPAVNRPAQQASLQKETRVPVTSPPSPAGSLVSKSHPEVVIHAPRIYTGPEHLPALPKPQPRFEIEATIIETRAVPDATRGTLHQSLVVSGRGPCSKCGQVHAPTDVPVGHATEGWFELVDGVSCGVSPMSHDQIVARLQQSSEALVTAMAPVPVVNRQLAEIGLTEQQGFRRHLTRDADESDTVDFLQGGFQLALRPTLEDNGTIRLDVGDSNASEPSKSISAESMASLQVPPGSCIVLGGLYFESERSPSEAVSRAKRISSILAGKSTGKNIHEVVVVICVRQSTDSASPPESQGSSVPVPQSPALLSIPALVAPKN